MSLEALSCCLFGFLCKVSCFSALHDMNYVPEWLGSSQTGYLKSDGYVGHSWSQVICKDIWYTICFYRWETRGPGPNSIASFLRNGCAFCMCVSNKKKKRIYIKLQILKTLAEDGFMKSGLAQILFGTHQLLHANTWLSNFTKQGTPPLILGQKNPYPHHTPHSK